MEQMMDYSQMKDYEINAAIGEALGWNAKYIHQDDSVTFRDDLGRLRGRKNYCNSWADAGPIIEKNLICLAADVFAEDRDGGVWIAQPAYGWDSEKVRHDNPLRAAMIVFLMMQEACNV